jgi:non-homologous end joining protein Ku
MSKKSPLVYLCAVIWFFVAIVSLSNISTQSQYKFSSLREATHKSPWSYHYTDRDCGDHVLKNEFTGFTEMQKGFWGTINDTVIANAKNEWKSFILNFEYPSIDFKGRAILYSG